MICGSSITEGLWKQDLSEIRETPPTFQYYLINIHCRNCFFSIVFFWETLFDGVIKTVSQCDGLNATIN